MLQDLQDSTTPTTSSFSTPERKNTLQTSDENYSETKARSISFKINDNKYNYRNHHCSAANSTFARK